MSTFHIHSRLTLDVSAVLIFNLNVLFLDVWSLFNVIFKRVIFIDIVETLPVKERKDTCNHLKLTSLLIFIAAETLRMEKTCRVIIKYYHFKHLCPHIESCFKYYQSLLQKPYNGHRNSHRYLSRRE